MGKLYTTLSYKKQPNNSLVLTQDWPQTQLLVSIGFPLVFLLIGWFVFFGGGGGIFFFALFLASPTYMFLSSLWQLLLGRHRLTVAKDSQSIRYHFREIGRFQDITHIELQETANSENQQWLVHLVTEENTLLWSGHSIHQQDVETAASLLGETIGVSVHKGKD